MIDHSGYGDNKDKKSNDANEPKNSNGGYGKSDNGGKIGHRKGDKRDKKEYGDKGSDKKGYDDSTYSTTPTPPTSYTGAPPTNHSWASRSKVSNPEPSPTNYGANVDESYDATTTTGTDGYDMDPTDPVIYVKPTDGYRSDSDDNFESAASLTQTSSFVLLAIALFVQG